MFISYGLTFLVFFKTKKIACAKGAGGLLVLVTCSGGLNGAKNIPSDRVLGFFQQQTVTKSYGALRAIRF